MGLENYLFQNLGTAKERRSPPLAQRCLRNAVPQGALGKEKEYRIKYYHRQRVASENMISANGILTESKSVRSGSFRIGI